jgi:hypothetical protein
MLARTLCAEAAVEQDSVKLMQLVSEINRMVLEKEERLQRQRQEVRKEGAA